MAFVELQLGRRSLVAEILALGCHSRFFLRVLVILRHMEDPQVQPGDGTDETNAKNLQTTFGIVIYP